MAIIDRAFIDEELSKVLALPAQSREFEIIVLGISNLKDLYERTFGRADADGQFFSKLMLIDWRKDEQFFMQHLLDGDFTANNGGWQWSASTGCDASPWFRLFSPLRQSQNFDCEGAFIRQMVPELATLNNKAIHNPPATLRKKLAYPDPIIDYPQARQRVLARFKNLDSIARQQ